MLERIRTADKSSSIWSPEPGEVLAGKIVDERVVENRYGESPVLDILREGDGRIYTVFLFHTVLRNEIARQRAKVGDIIGLRYDGKARGKHW